MKVLETQRLSLRWLVAGDAEFILELLNEPAFLKNIGDKGVRSIVDACGYIASGPGASYERYGFGLYLVELKDSGVPIGMCGLLKRDSLEDVDVGFAFLERFWSKGYAYESAAAVMDHGRRVLGLSRIVAVTAPHNAGSINVLQKLGLRYEKKVGLAEGESQLFVPSA